jgi:hypothetical protein
MERAWNVHTTVDSATETALARRDFPGELQKHEVFVGCVREAALSSEAVDFDPSVEPLYDAAAKIEGRPSDPAAIAAFVFRHPNSALLAPKGCFRALKEQQLVMRELLLVPEVYEISLWGNQSVVVVPDFTSTGNVGRLIPERAVAPVFAKLWRK